MPRVSSRKSEAQLEAEFQSDLIRELEDLYPGCVILKNDSLLRQGIPDLTVFWKNKWVWLEVKAAWNSPHRPNQDWYVDMGDAMSYAAFVYPENKEQILDEIQATFRTARSPRVSIRQ